MIRNTKLYSLNDVAIMPADISDICHRSACNPYDEEGLLPVFTSPMPCVIDENTASIYQSNKIHTIIPRTVMYSYRIEAVKTGQWVAFSLNEFRNTFINNGEIGPYKVLIDIANGNMQCLIDAIREAKKINPELVIMAGNVANPDTFYALSNVGTDYIRLSVGSGAGCITSTSTGVYYPMASLIDSCAEIKNELDKFYDNKVKIVADGGIWNYRDAIKCLALGADYVMMGKRLAQCEDSAAELNVYSTLRQTMKKTKTYYGMASDEGMEMLGKKCTREGKCIEVPVDGTIESFATEFTDYLRSAMSYCGAYTLQEFKSKTVLNVISESASKQFNQER